MKKIFGTSWRTTALGVVLMLLGGWAFFVHWVPNQTVYFNLVYVELAPLAVIATGWLGIHCRDHRTSSEDAGLKKDK